jgi:hypothetical protein
MVEDGLLDHVCPSALWLGLGRAYLVAAVDCLWVATPVDVDEGCQELGGLVDETLWYSYTGLGLLRGVRRLEGGTLV